MTTFNLANNVHLHIYPTQQFKDVTLSVRFLNSIENCNTTLRYFLASYLSDRCHQYPTKSDVTKQLDYLFGAKLEGTMEFIGKASYLELRCSVINEKYSQKEILEKQIQFLSSFIFHPIWDDENFFNEIKQRILLMISSFMDNPGSYAANNAQSNFNELLKLKSIPSKEEVESYTLDQLKQAYNELIQKDWIDIFVLGEVDSDEVFSLVSKFLSFSDRKSDDFSVPFLAQKEKRDDIVEEKDCKQSHLVVYYTTQKYINDKFHFALMIANAILGVFPTSHLFQEIREKRSLCYSIHSSYESFDGLIKIQTAISKKDIPEVLELIEKQIQRIQHGDFDEELLTSTKKMMINSLKSSKDSQKRILNQNYNNVLLKKDRPFDSLISSLEKVSSEDVIDAFKELTLKLTYTLTSKGEANEENL